MFINSINLSQIVDNIVKLVKKSEIIHFNKIDNYYVNFIEKLFMSNLNI